MSFRETRPDEIARRAISPDASPEARPTRDPGSGGWLVADSKHAGDVCFARSSVMGRFGRVAQQSLYRAIEG